MSFTSGAPRNNDPHPWLCPDGLIGNRCPSGHDTYAPRPGFDLPKRDDANPILVELREAFGASSRPDARRRIVQAKILEVVWDQNQVDPDWTFPQADHAFRVLGRWLRLEEQ